MVKDPTSTGELNDAETRALRTLIDYAAARKILNRQTMLDACGMSAKALSDLYQRKSKQRQKDIVRYVKRAFDEHGDVLDPWIKPAYAFLFQSDLVAEDDSFAVFDNEIRSAAMLTDKDVAEFCAEYAGRYRFFRFSARKRRTARQGVEYDMVSGRFEITPPGPGGVAPRFAGRFGEAETLAHTNEQTERGVIVPFGDAFCCFGVEYGPAVRKPIYLYCKKSAPGSDYFRALVTRKYTRPRDETGTVDQVLSSRVIYVREERVPEVVRNSDIKYLEASDIRFLKTEFGIDPESLRNTVSDRGRSVLFLED